MRRRSRAYGCTGCGRQVRGPVVLLHGWPQTWYAWRKVIPELARHHEVFAVDLPGLGDSGSSPHGHGVRIAAEADASIPLRTLLPGLGHYGQELLRGGSPGWVVLGEGVHGVLGVTPSRGQVGAAFDLDFPGPDGQPLADGSTGCALMRSSGLIGVRMHRTGHAETRARLGGLYEESGRR
ncbi:alpha/beta fold hydrolase [Streptomyces javensis]|uniref:alpha/beta fold hydrolase n=1 Tax=Streptomyces javensis TaxID=114698 RepID=UPI003F4D274B